MDQQSTFFSLIFLIFITISIFIRPSSSATANTTTETYTDFIKTSCNYTTYPSVCTTSLLPYATAIKSTPLRLVKQSLSATLKYASTTQTIISKLAKAKNITTGEYAVLEDCIGDIQSAISEINDSLKAILSLKSSEDKKFVLSNAQTWTSAAITDEYSCTDGFSDTEISPVVMKKIKTSIVSLAMLSSNALYFINHLDI